MIAELEAMRKQHLKIAFIVDDNLIGNKVAVKKLLRDIADWQAAEGYPFTFFTEASLNLSEDDALMQLMDAANIVTVFIGIESPNEDSLKETKKYQNVRKGGSIVDRVRKVQDSGIEVWCGMIVGFDHDDARIFKAQHEFVRQTTSCTRWSACCRHPEDTALRRLKDEGRLDLDDEQTFGTNVIPLGMTRDELRDGYIGLMQELYEPDFYFERLENLFLTREFKWARAREAYWRRHPWRKWKSPVPRCSRWPSACSYG
ncbi:DUF4070 domain-containing protein [Mycolicibacterium vaccae]|nr:DUF4070 domain-containing protein [Mycolicibacterium vaccae]